MKILSDEVEAITKIVLYEYTTTLGSMQKGEMLSNLEVRLRDLFEHVHSSSDQLNTSEHLQYRIMAKCKKILDMLNGRTIVAVFRATRYAKKIKTYHEKLRRIRTDLEVRSDCFIIDNVFLTGPRQLLLESKSLGGNTQIF